MGYHIYRYIIHLANALVNEYPRKKSVILNCLVKPLFFFFVMHE